MIGSGASTDSMMAASFGIIDSIISTTLTTSSLSATSAFHGGGVGVLRGVGARAIRTAITAVKTTAGTGPGFGTAVNVGVEWVDYRGGFVAAGSTLARTAGSLCRRGGGEI